MKDIKNKKFLILGGIAVIILGVGIYLKVGGKIGGMSPKKAAEQVVNFVNTNMLGGQATSSLVSIKDESGLYKITLKIQDQEVDTYATRDGKYFFAEAYDMAKFAAEEAKRNAPTPKSEKPDVKLFVMSYCPYGKQAEDLIFPVMKLLGDAASFEFHYVIGANPQGGDKYCLDKEGKYCSLHGIEELKQDVRELCVQKYDKAKLISFMTKINNETTVANVASKWEVIAKAVGIDVNKIKDCEKNESLALVESEVNLGTQFGAEGSPMLFINGKEYSKDRTAEGYKNGICEAMNKTSDKCSQNLSQAAATTTASGGCAQ